jgi:hypothetical protein
MYDYLNAYEKYLIASCHIANVIEGFPLTQCILSIKWTFEFFHLCCNMLCFHPFTNCSFEWVLNYKVFLV